MAYIMFTLSDEFHDAIDAATQDISRAELIRRAVAQYIDYPYPLDKPQSRRHKYANPQEARLARQEAQRARRAQNRAIVKAARQALTTNQIEGLVHSK